MSQHRSDRAQEHLNSGCVDHAEGEVVHRKSRYGALLLTLGFMAIFTAFLSAESLQTSVNAELGYINLSTMYALVALLTNVAPMMLRRLEGRGASYRGVFIVCMLMYGSCVVSNVWPTALSMIPGSIAVGVSGPFLWTAQREYLGRLALQASRATGVSLNETTSSLNALFQTGLMGCGAIGNIVNSTVLIIVGVDKVGWVFSILFTISLLAIIPFLMLPHIPCCHPDESQSRSICSGIWRPMKFAFTDRCMRLFIPLMFSNGWCIATQWGDYHRFSVSAVVGMGLQGFVMAVFFFASAVFSYAWGKVVSNGWMSQMQVLMLATVINICFFVLWFCGLTQAPRFYYDINTHSWIRIPGCGPPTIWEYMSVFLGVVFFALGQSAYGIEVNAVIQTIFQDTPYSVEANSTNTLWQGLGRSAQFLMSSLYVDACRSRVLVSIFLTVLNFGMIRCIGSEQTRRADEQSRHVAAAPVTIPA